MEEINNLRGFFDKLGQIYPKVPTVKIKPEVINGINSYWFTPKDVIPGRIVIYLHGGSFAFGSIRSHESMVTHISDKLHSKILFIAYGLAPEHPFPDGIHDVIKVYQKVLETYPGDQIDFIGDSAGGGLLISAISELTKLQLPLPKVAVLISPWVRF